MSTIALMTDPVLQWVIRDPFNGNCFGFNDRKDAETYGQQFFEAYKKAEPIADIKIIKQADLLQALSKYTSFEIYKQMRRTDDGFPLRWHWQGYATPIYKDMPRCSPQFGFDTAAEAVQDFINQVSKAI